MELTAKGLLVGSDTDKLGNEHHGRVDCSRPPDGEIDVRAGQRASPGIWSSIGGPPLGHRPTARLRPPDARTATVCYISRPPSVCSQSTKVVDTDAAQSRISISSASCAPDRSGTCHSA
jgi:hypothetical protein